MHYVRYAVADPPLGPIFFQFHTVFRNFWPNNRLALLLLGLASLPLEGPGSAPGTCISVFGPTPNCYIYHIWRVRFHHKWRSVAYGTPRWSGCDVRTSCCRDTRRTARNGNLHTCRMKTASTPSATQKQIVLIVNTFCEVDPGAGYTLKFFEAPPPPPHTLLWTKIPEISWDYGKFWQNKNAFQ